MFFVLVLLASASLGGCGRRGPLELPPGAPTQAENTATLADKQAATLNDSGPAGVIQSPNQVVQVDKSSAQAAALPPSRPINGPQAAPASHFILDSLL